MQTMKLAPEFVVIQGLGNPLSISYPAVFPEDPTPWHRTNTLQAQA